MIETSSQCGNTGELSPLASRAWKTKGTFLLHPTESLNLLGWKSPPKPSSATFDLRAAPKERKPIPHIIK